jgi:hypothetical protein
MAALSFSKDTPNKIGDGIDVSGKNTLVKTETKYGDRVAIADEPIDGKIDGKKMFCVRVDNGTDSGLMIGFTLMETFDSTRDAYLGSEDFTGCGILLCNGNLFYPVDKHHNIIDDYISKKAKESSSSSPSATAERRRKFVFFVMDMKHNLLTFLNT